MKKFIFVLLIMFSTSVYSYSLLYIGSVESREWNDFGDKFYNYPLKIYAGGKPDGSEKTILIEIKNAFGDDYKKYFVSKKCRKKQIEKGRCPEDGFRGFNNNYYDLKRILTKSIEWSNIAKENKIEKVNKDIIWEGGRIFSPFGGGNARFFSQGAYQADLILPVWFHLSEGKDRYYSLKAQENFLRHLNNVEETIIRSINENKKSDDLFN